MRFDSLAAIAFTAFVLGLVGGYVTGQRRSTPEMDSAAAKHDRLWRHVQEVRFMLTKVTPDEEGAALARDAAFRLGLSPDELPQ